MDTRWTKTVSIFGAVAAAVVVAAGSAAAPSSMLDPADPLALEVKALHDDISLANLIRGLSLTGDQTAALADVAVRADTLRAAHGAAAQPLLAEMDGSFAALRAELLAVDEPDPEVERRAVAAQNALKDQRREFERELADLELELRSVLDGGQLAIIEEFKPCLIPPQELGEPARVGQSDTGGRAQEVLGELRVLPDNTYARRVERFVDHGIERVELRTGPLSDEARADHRAELRAVADQARALDDVAWAMEGQELAAQLKAIVEGERGGKPPAAPEGAELTRVGRLLLAPGASGVLAALAAR